MCQGFVPQKRHLLLETKVLLEKIPAAMIIVMIMMIVTTMRVPTAK